VARTGVPLSCLRSPCLLCPSVPPTAGLAVVGAGAARRHASPRGRQGRRVDRASGFLDAAFAQLALSLRARAGRWQIGQMHARGMPEYASPRVCASQPYARA